MGVRKVLIVVPAVLMAMIAAGGARAASVTDAGAGFPLSLNPSDHLLIAHLVFEQNEKGEDEENIAGPWSLWAEGSSTPLEPLNGGPETSNRSLGENEHDLFLYRLNAAGNAGGTSTISYLKEGKERTVHRAVYYTPDGIGHEVPPLSETILNEKGEEVVVGALGTGIDEANDVSGIGVVKAGGHLRSRGFFSVGGTAHPSVVGESDGPWTTVTSMNEAGTMFGSVSEVKDTEIGEGKTEEEPVNTKYALWKTPGGSATILNFTAPITGFPLASDGSALGFVGGKLELRAPGGAETEVAGLSKPIAVNAAHTVLGSIMVSGAEHAAFWQAGKVTDLNTLLPKGSGWVLSRATAINDGGDIAGIGSHEGRERAFLFKPEIGEQSSISGSPSVALPEAGTKTEEFTVSLAEPSAETVTVGYETEDGTATAENDDYTEASGTLSFAPGETSKKIAIQIDHGDGNDGEAKEVYRVRLEATATSTPAPAATTAEGTVGLPGLSGQLTTSPATGAPLPASPAAGVTVQVSGKTTAGVAVAKTFTSNAKGEYEAFVDPGTYSVTATGVPAGAPAGFTWSPGDQCPGKRKGAACENLKMGEDEGLIFSGTVNFGYGQRDPQVENIEVLQATQLKTFDKEGTEITTPGGTKMKSYEYSGVGLAAGSDTLVRVYASNNGPGTAEEVTAQLQGYSSSGGTLTALPGGPLTPLNGANDALPAPAFNAERPLAAATFNFRLPVAWTKGKIVLAARVDPAEQFPACANCRDNDNMALTGVEFTEVPALKYIPISLEWKEGTKTIAPSEPVAAVSRTWPFWPVAAGGLEAVGKPISVDLTEPLAAVANALKTKLKLGAAPLKYNAESFSACLGSGNLECDDLLEGKLFALEKAALPESAGSTIAVGVFNSTGLEYGVLGAANDIPGQFSYVPDAPDKAFVVVHEMLHQLGFKHSGCTGASDEETWPQNEMGQAALVGFGENRSLATLGGIGPIIVTRGESRGQGSHDIMSYCYPTWPSTFNWDRVLNKLAKDEAPKPVSSYPAYSSLTATTASARAAAGGLVTVQAIQTQSTTPEIVNIEPGAHAEGGERTGYTAEALDAHGRVVARAPVLATHTHADVVSPHALPDDQTFLQIELPARGLAGIALAQGKHVLASVRVPKGKLGLTVSAIAKKQCRTRGPLRLHFKARPGPTLFTSVRVKALAGHRRRTIEVGSEHGTIVLPKGSRPAGATKLLVEYSDGFATATKKVKVPKGCRAG